MICRGVTLKCVDGVVEAVDVAAAEAFPDFDAAGVDELWGVAFCRREQPGDEGAQLLRLVAFDRIA